MDLAIWLPQDLYRRLPIILPYVVRDPSCRPRGKIMKDEWGSANEKGFLRDDNTLIKGLVRSFVVHSSGISSYDGRRIGTGFVACHIWGMIDMQGKSIISSRHHMLNSFVPNLVWLPVQISKLTDREGSFSQRLLQAISYKIYRNIGMPQAISELWKFLPFPSGFEDISVEASTINSFVIPDAWIKTRVSNLFGEIDQILGAGVSGSVRSRKVKCERYLPTLERVSAEKRAELAQWLTKYREMLVSLQSD